MLGDCKCWVSISISHSGNAVSYKLGKIKWKVSYVLSGELSGKIFSHFVFSSRNLKVSIFPLEISRLINFIFSRKKMKDIECWEMIANVSFGKTSLDFIF